MGQNEKIKQSVEIVFCIDITSATQPLVGELKNHLYNLYKLLSDTKAKQAIVLDRLLVKIIAFRDLYYDGDEALYETDFYELPKQQHELNHFINSLECYGGGDEPESGLEALALAMRSNWQEMTNLHNRQLIVVITDAAAHPLDVDKEKGSNYPADLPKNFDAITDEWNNKHRLTKKLVLFAPDAYPWSDMSTYWGQVVHTRTTSVGCQEIDINIIINMISSTISIVR